jgi:NAD(P)-dependent dehydrogenase (short-subunit alcohol dehydrogenase family)
VNESRVVIVTGCSGAIGSAICERLLANGFSIVGVDRNGNTADFKEPDFTLVRGDVTSGETRQEAVSRAVADGTALVGLVNCAAVVPTLPALEISTDDWSATIGINLYAAYFFSVAVAAVVKPNGRGSIVNIGSIAGARPSPSNLAYGASKAALASMTTSLAVALAGDGIRVNLVSPGLIDTPLTAAVDVSLAEVAGVAPADIRARRVAAIPLGRMGDVTEVAAAVSFLLSDQASYITGQALHVNGGSLTST